MRISDWSSDVCSSDLSRHHRAQETRRRDADDEPGEQEAEDDATDADAHQDEHIMDEPAEGREARLDRERISQGEDADRGEREHPADDDQHRVAERLEQPRQRRALYGVEADRKSTRLNSSH